MGADRGSWEGDRRDDGGRGGGKGGKGGKSANSDLTKPCIWLGGLPNDITESEVQRVCSRFGVISQISVKHSQRDTFVFVNFNRLEHAQEAIKELDQSNAFGFGTIKAAPATRRNTEESEQSSGPPSRGHREDKDWNRSDKQWDDQAGGRDGRDGRDRDRRGYDDRDGDRHRDGKGGKGGGRDDRDRGYGYDDRRDHRDDRSGYDRNDSYQSRGGKGGRERDWDDRNRGAVDRGDRGDRDRDHGRYDDGPRPRGEPYGRGRDDDRGKGGRDDRGKGGRDDRGKGGRDDRGGKGGYDRGYDEDRRHDERRDVGYRDRERPRYEEPPPRRPPADDFRGRDEWSGREPPAGGRRYDDRQPQPRRDDRGGARGGPPPAADDRRDQGRSYRGAGGDRGAGPGRDTRAPARRPGSRSRSPLRAQAPPSSRGVRVHINNLPNDMDDGELRDTVSAYGQVLETKCFPGPNGSKRGWAEFSSRRDAEAVVAELDQRSMAEWHMLLEAFIDDGQSQGPGGPRR